MKTWTCPNKQLARQKTIIEPYHEFFHESLPGGKQYWCTCGLSATHNGIIANCELDQMLKAQLIQLEQFRGVDQEEEHIESNRKHLPHIKWFHNDFIEQIEISYNEGDFNPGIIDVDIIHMKDKATVYLGRLLSFLTEIEIKDVLVVANMMLCNPNKGQEIVDGNEIITRLCEVNSFRSAWASNQWEFHDKRFEYVGQQYGTKTVLASYLFYRKDTV